MATNLSNRTHLSTGLQFSKLVGIRLRFAEKRKKDAPLLGARLADLQVASTTSEPEPEDSNAIFNPEVQYLATADVRTVLDNVKNMGMEEAKVVGEAVRREERKKTYTAQREAVEEAIRIVSEDHARRWKEICDKIYELEQRSYCEMCHVRPWNVVYNCGHTICSICDEKLREVTKYVRCHKCQGIAWEKRIIYQ